jgi:hypothetical protein
LYKSNGALPKKDSLPKKQKTMTSASYVQQQKVFI